MLSGLVVTVLGAVLVLVAMVPVRGRQAAAGPQDASVRAQERGARRRAVCCLVLAASLLVGGLVAGTALPQLLGLPLAVAPGLAAAAALLGFAALPVRTLAPVGPVTASLARRTPWTYGSRAAFALPALLAVLTLAFLAWAAAVAAPDEQGRPREFALLGPGISTSAGPFPGGFYGAPLALVTVLLAAATYVALRRVAGTPTLPRLEQAGADRRWRLASTRLVLRLAGAALLAQLGATAAFAGLAMRSAAVSLAAMGGRHDPSGPAGTVIVLVGVLLVLLGTVSAALAVREVLALVAVRREGAGASAAAPVVP